MTITLHNKLVRDEIPQILRDYWDCPITRIAFGEEFFEKLKAKLGEETTKYLDSDNPEKLADILEVIYALAEHHNISIDKLKKMRLSEQASRWSFKRRIILEHTINAVQDTLENQ